MQVADFAFSPADLTIAAGDAVTWTNAADQEHTVTADDGAFDSGRIPAGDAYANVFETPGTFPYHCTIHPQMTGTITVGAAAATDVPTGSGEPEPPEGTLPPSFVANPTPAPATQAASPAPSADGEPANASGGGLAWPIVLVVLLVGGGAVGAWIVSRRRTRP